MGEVIMTDIDVTEIRIILEDLSEEQLINILEKNGYTNKGKKNVLIRGKKTVTLIKVKKMY